MYVHFNEPMYRSRKNAFATRYKLLIVSVDWATLIQKRKSYIMHSSTVNATHKTATDRLRKNSFSFIEFRL